MENLKEQAIEWYERIAIEAQDNPDMLDDVLNIDMKIFDLEDDGMTEEEAIITVFSNLFEGSK